MNGALSVFSSPISGPTGAAFTLRTIATMSLLSKAVSNSSKATMKAFGTTVPSFCRSGKKRTLWRREAVASQRFSASSLKTSRGTPPSWVFWKPG